MHPDSLISICRSERKVIYTPLFRKRREIRGHIGLVHARNRRSHVVSGGVVHGAHQRFTPFAPPVLFGDGLAGRGPQRGAVGAGQVEQHVEQHGIMVEPARSSPTLGSLGLRPVANSDNVRCSRTSSVTQRTMSRSNPMRSTTTVACRAPSAAWLAAPGRLPMSCRMPASSSAS